MFLFYFSGEGHSNSRISRLREGIPIFRLFQLRDSTSALTAAYITFKSLAGQENTKMSSICFHAQCQPKSKYVLLNTSYRSH